MKNTKSRLRIALIGAGSGLAFAGGIAGVSALLLPACAILVPLGLGELGHCPSHDVEVRRQTMAEFTERRRHLEAEVRRLMRDLATIQCVPGQVDVLPAPEVQNGIDQSAWERGDISTMQGCWLLDSEFQIRDRGTGELATQQEWSVCFDEDGGGQQVMRGEGGSECKGPITGAFNENGDLVLEEPGDLQCNNGSYIYERENVCTINDAGEAVCESYQPETGGRDTVKLRKENNG